MNNKNLCLRINEGRITELLDELETDRKTLFDDIKKAKTYDKLKNSKLKAIESIQKSVVSYRCIMIKEEEDSKKE